MAANKTTFVLVHGAYQDAHAWSKIKPILEAEGHTVVGHDLPAHGQDHTPAGEVKLQHYVDAVVALVKAQPGKVVLGGHSMAGAIISSVAEHAADKIEKLVYICAFLLKDGQAIMDFAGVDAGSDFGKNLVPSPDGSYADFKPEELIHVFATDTDAATQEYLLGHINQEPLSPFVEKVSLHNEAAAAIPKYFIHTTLDKAISYDLQLRMVAENGPVEKAFTLHTSHSPYLAQPEAFAQILDQIAGGDIQLIKPAFEAAS